MEQNSTRWYTLTLFVLFGAVAAYLLLQPASVRARTYRYAHIEATGDGDLIFSHARDKSYCVTWSIDSDREAVQTLTDLLAHGVTGKDSELQDVFVRGILRDVVATNYNGVPVRAFDLEDWHIRLPFYFLTTWEPAPTDSNRRDSLKEIGMDTYEWGDGYRSYSRYER